MKKKYYFALICVICKFIVTNPAAFSQDIYSYVNTFRKGTAEKRVVEFINLYKDSLDNLEGIWELKTKSTFRWAYKNEEEAPDFSEREIVILKSFDNYYQVFLVENGAIINNIRDLFKFSNSALPNRFWCSPNLPAGFNCCSVNAIPFTITNNTFSISYEFSFCNPSGGNTSWDKFNRKVTDTWTKIYPSGN